MRVETATYLDGSGKICMALSGVDWIWADFVEFGWISLDSCKNVNVFGWVLEDLADFERL